jgi:nitroreductase
VTTSSPRIGASGLDLDVVDHLLTTTRSVRKRLDLDRAVPTEVLLECLELAIQAPTGTNSESWRFIVVTDPAQRAAIADLYRNPVLPDVPTAPDVADSPRQQRVMASAQYLTQHIHEVPALIVPCVEESGGAMGWPPSIYPAVWSLILALRSRGLGSTLTTVHLWRKHEADTILGVPDGFVQACLLPVAYFTGDDFKPAKRRPITDVVFADRWGTAIR